MKHKVLWRFYTLTCPITREVKYVGITSGSLQKRLREHLNDKDYKEMAQWIDWLHSQGQLPIIEQIDFINGTRKQAEHRESGWVYKYIRAGHNLINRDYIPGADREEFFDFLRNDH